MKIGILGSPGVGKTKFAHDLQAELSGGTSEHPMIVLDNYVDDLRNITRLEYGEFGDFVDDLQVVFKRREWELAWQDRCDTITVGTVLDSVIHNFTRTEAQIQTRYEIGLQQQRLTSVAATFGLLYTETWDYDYAFFLPTNDEYGKAMHELITTYQAPILTFNPEVTDDEKASTAAAAIRALEADESAPSEERGVRSSREDGEEDGDLFESVPDVPEQGNNPDDA